MLVTLIADASYCPDTGAAGYGVWVACERGKKAFSGRVSKPVGGNIQAEMIAIVNGLYHAAREQLIAKGDSVIIQTDCLAAIDALLYARAKQPTGVTVVANQYIQFIKKLNLTITLRHVKGHTQKEKNPEPRFAANRACDKAAKKYMRIMRNTIQANRAKALIDAD